MAWWVAEPKTAWLANTTEGCAADADRTDPAGDATRQRSGRVVVAVAPNDPTWSVARLAAAAACFRWCRLRVSGGIVSQAQASQKVSLRVLAEVAAQACSSSSLKNYSISSNI